MNESTGNSQGHVDRYFDQAAAYWEDVYAAVDVQGLVYRRRLETAVRWATDLPLRDHAAALDVGCGAGLLSVALFRAGFSVTATDSSPEMVSTTERTLAEHGAGAAASVLRADVHSLPFESGHFDLVAGLGLLPWLHDVPSAVAELTRVLAHDGWLILSADNRNSLNRFVEPRQIRVLAPLKRVRHRLRASQPEGGPPAYRHRPSEVDAILIHAGIDVVRRTTVGYGPFTVLDRPVLPDRAGTWLHSRLERASASHRRLRGAGWHYLVAGKKA